MSLQYVLHFALLRWWEMAAEYNSYGTLTAVGTSGTQLGEGAYISPNINEWNVPSTYWQCLILADESKFNILYIPESSNAWFSSRRLRSFITNTRLNPERTVLFAKIDGDPDQHVQMLIPPYFLHRSPRFHGDYGRGDLGVEVICVPKSEQNTNYVGIANWGAEWRIPGWACDFFRKRDGTDSCPLQPSPVGPIIVPDTSIPAPSSDISTVSLLLHGNIDNDHFNGSTIRYIVLPFRILFRIAATCLWGVHGLGSLRLFLILSPRPHPHCLGIGVRSI
ncbi:hypothetical protein C8R44DRAFT_749484 [Mycena epipterygia]|nr:hypothetical protein C8R44DRAFT_749484 [Mycena epipterygia]